MGKPRLAISPEISARLSATTSPATTTAKAQVDAPATFRYRLGVLFRAFIVLLVFAILVLTACWAILIATVVATPIVDGKLYVVQRAPWVEGRAPEQSVTYVVSQPVQRDLLGRFVLQIGGDDKAAIMEVAAAANSDIAINKSGTIFVDGVATHYQTSTAITPHRLGNSYLMICISGPCGTPGTPSEVPIEHVLGKVLGSVKLVGLDPVPPLYGDQGDSRD